MSHISFVVSLALVASAGILAQKLTPEDLVKRHLEHALASADRAPRDREVRGTCQLSTTIMGAGRLDGPFTLTSLNDTSLFTLRFDQEVYEGESFGFDGEKVDVGFAQPRTSMRSALGLFLSLNRVAIREGLVGGVLNGQWALFHVAERQAKLSYEGIKKLDGRDLHRLRYRARRDQGDLSILLYFTPDTFRHVASVYESSRAQAMGRTPVESSQLTEQRFRLHESFSDFDSPLAPLPASWVVRYSRSGDSTVEWKYECTVQSLGPKR